MYLDPRSPALVDDLIKGMVVQSANDASLTLAEGVSGSEAAFVTLMNLAARRLGLRDTQFANATGQPHPAQRSTARDLASLARALIHDFPEEYKVFSRRDFTYAGISQHNHNRLLWLDPNVDGVKTGQTAGACYNLIASARRDARRLIAVVLRAATDTARATETQKLLNYGFQHYETVRLYRADEPVSIFRIYRGIGSKLGVGFLIDFYITVPRGSAARLKADVVVKQPLMAPARRGQAVAQLRMKLGDEVFASYPLVALDNVPVAGLVGRLWDSLLLMFK
jgi:D-alanyl-D-alanine carboxypeptidase (penicillin-binding protein 5/6)